MKRKPGRPPKELKFEDEESEIPELLPFEEFTEVTDEEIEEIVRGHNGSG